MNSYERVQATLAHKEPDRIPFDLGSTLQTGMNIKTYRRLREYLGMPAVRDNIINTDQQLAQIDDDMIDRLKVDVRAIEPKPPLNRGCSTDVSRDGESYRFRDEWGIDWRMPIVGGHYYNLENSPLDEAETLEDMSGYRWPDAVDPGRFATMQEQAERYLKIEKRACVLGRLGAGVLEIALWLNGYEKFFCDMLSNERYAQDILEKITDLKLQYWGKTLDAAGENVMIAMEGDDLGTQSSLLISSELYNRMVRPCHKRIFDFIHSRAKAPVSVFFHSCGAVKSLIPGFIEDGVDILNPVQINAQGMDPIALKKEFGRDVTFWGGGIDTQIILPNASPEKIRDEVRRTIEILAPGGGFVFTPVHNVQSDVPVKNYMAMWEALQEYGAY